MPEPNEIEPQPPPERERGKWGAYAFALVLSLFLGYQCVSAERRGAEVSPVVWMPTLLLIGAALGVEVDPEFIGKFFK